MTDTINIPRAELQQILAAYKEISSPLDCGCWPCKGECRNAFSLGIVVEEYQHLANKQIPILEARLAQQEEKPKPVAWFDKKMNGLIWKEGLLNCHFDDRQPLYTSPPQREWQGLTDEEVEEFECADVLSVRAIEAKLKERNTP